MAEIELVLKADNSQYVQKVREAQNATQDLHNKASEGMKREKGLIADVEDEIKKYQEAWRNAKTPEQIEKIRKKLEEAKFDLKEYEKIGVKANENIKKSTDEVTAAMGNVVKKLGPVALALGLITKVAKDTFLAFKDTTLGLKLMTAAGQFWQQVTYNIATGNFNMVQSFNAVAIATELINRHRVQERKDLVETAKLRETYNKLYFESADRTQTNTDRLGDINKAMGVHNELIDVELRNAREQLKIVEFQLISRPKSNKLLDEEAKLQAQLLGIEGRRWSETKRLEMQRSTIENQLEDEKKKNLQEWLDAIDKTNKDALKIQEDYQNLALKLLDDYDKSQIDSLEGIPKLKAERDFGIKQIKEFRDQLAALGAITDEQMAMFEAMGANVWKAYYAGIAEAAQKVTPNQKDAVSKALLENMPSLAGIQKSFIDTQVGKAPEEFSVWKLIGIDPDDEEGQEMVEAVKDAAGKIGDALNEALEQRVEIAQRERELLDTKISETQREIELEVELAKEGFANNLTARQAYLGKLKVQRDQALIAEEKAIKQEQLMAKITQTTNILSGVSNIIATFTKIPIVGIILAAAAVASLWAIWGKAKSKTQELAEGGSGTDKGLVTGKRHSRGGERFLDHVNVEQGEAFGVLSRQATGKYGKVFHEIVSSFNKNEFPDITPSVNNTVRIDNNGSNSRLDKVIREQQKMNSQLKQTQLTVVNGKRIYKNGNKVRIIG